MKFFIPFATDDKQAENVWAATKKFAEENLQWKITDRRIFSIKYTHEGKSYYSEVGKQDLRTGEVVIAILESTTFLVCTPNRGVARGEPMLVGINEVESVINFE